MAQDNIQREVQRRRRDSEILEEAMRPWADYSRQGDNVLGHHGYDADEFFRVEAQMMDDIDRASAHMRYVNPNARQVQALAEGIARDYQIPYREALQNIQRMVGGRGRGNDVYSQAVALGVPSAHADEKMSMAALQLSGFDDVGPLNVGDFAQATDIGTTFEGRPFNIDAQKQIRPGNLMQLGALQNVETRERIGQALRRMPGHTKVLDALLMLQANSRALSGEGLTSRSPQGDFISVSGNEDKLMQSVNPEFNPNPSETFLRNQEALRKDGLIWSDRAGYSPTRPELYGKGPYDAEASHGLYLVDFENLRGDLASMTLDEMYEKGFDIQGNRTPANRRRLERDARDRGNQLSDVKLILPKSYMKNARGDLPRFAGEALDVLTTRRSRR